MPDNTNDFFPKKIEDPRDVMLYDYLTVIRDYGGKTKTECFIGADVPLSKIKARKGSKITVIAESPLHGEIYRYGNHGDYWEQIGEVCGYA